MRWPWSPPTPSPVRPWSERFRAAEKIPITWETQMVIPWLIMAVHLMDHHGVTRDQAADWLATKEQERGVA